MATPTRRKLYLVLCGNAALLAVMAACLWDRRPATAAAQQTPPPPVSGVTIMPGQLSPQTWGCYLYDAEHQTLCVYQYRPGEHELRLEAARDVSYDRLLKLYNTSPPPTEVHRLSDLAASAPKAAPRE